MKITRRQLRQIIKEELTKTCITEGELVSGWKGNTVEEKVDMLYRIMSLKPWEWWSGEETRGS